MYSILVIDENASELLTCQKALQEIAVVLQVSSAKAAFDRMQKYALPDLVIVDLALSGTNGFEVLMSIKTAERTKNIPVIMVTAKTSEMDLVGGIEDGADDYLKKPFSVMELISRVKALIRRTSAVDDETIVLGEIVINNDRHSCSVSGREVVLTYKEYELLKYLIINKGNVLSREQIMNRVWGTDYEGETRTVDMHIKTLRHKLNDAGERIKTVRNVGYVIE